jgi:hypothetical protein
LSWICAEKPELLPADKVERFKQLMTCPLPTIQLTQAINIALSRVFEGQDKFFRYDFKDDTKLDDWQEFRDDGFWKEEGMQAMINAIDSVWVADLPQEQEGDKPEPCNRLIDISNVIDISCKRNGECLYVIFAIGEKLFVYDDESICVFDYQKEKIGELISEFFHELSYCPARMFWSDYLGYKNCINHKAPLTNVLSELDWLLVHKVFKKYMDIANSFPILVKYQSGQDFGDLTKENNKGRTEGQKQTAGKGLIGPGTIVEVPIPIEGQPDLMANPLAWVSPAVDTLNFHVSEDVRLTDYIFKTSVGIDGEQTNDQAKNEKQVLASFENQSIILRRLAQNFEKIQTFAEKTIIALRYGEEVTVSIDYGSKFFLKTADDLMAEKEAMTGDDVMVDAVSSELIETKFRNDSGGKMRANVIQDLDPLPGKTIDEVIKIKNAGGIDKISFIIKLNLMSFVRRFEREQLPIAQFMKVGEYNERVKIILDEFKKYVNEFSITPVATTDKTSVVKTTVTPVNQLAVEDVQKTALNGAQVSALIELIMNIGTGVVSKETAKGIIVNAFPTFTDEEVDQIVNNVSIKKNNTKTPVATVSPTVVVEKNPAKVKAGKVITNK